MSKSIKILHLVQNKITCFTTNNHNFNFLFPPWVNTIFMKENKHEFMNAKKAGVFGGVKKACLYY